MTIERLEYIEKKTKASIKKVDNNLEPNLQLKQVGQIRHLKEKNLEWLQAAIELPNVITKAKLYIIIKSLG